MTKEDILKGLQRFSGDGTAKIPNGYILLSELEERLTKLFAEAKKQSVQP